MSSNNNDLKVTINEKPAPTTIPSTTKPPITPIIPPMTITAPSLALTIETDSTYTKTTPTLAPTVQADTTITSTMGYTMPSAAITTAIPSTTVTPTLAPKILATTTAIPYTTPIIPPTIPYTTPIIPSTIPSVTPIIPPTTPIIPSTTITIPSTTTTIPSTTITAPSTTITPTLASTKTITKNKEYIDDTSEFDVSETKENKVKFSDNSLHRGIGNSPTHPTTRSESSLNITLTDSGRVKRKCVIEGEKRRLYLSDFDSPPFMTIEDDIQQKIPRVRGRRGRPPKSAAGLSANDRYDIRFDNRYDNRFDRYGMGGIRRFNEMGNQPAFLYHSSQYDGFTYTFSTALANVSCRLVLDGHFRNIVDHHRTVTFPQNIFTNEIIPNIVQQHQKQNILSNANTMNRQNMPSHQFNQPGPHMFRTGGVPQMSSHHMSQQQPQSQPQLQPPHMYHGMMPPSQPIPQQSSQQQQQQQQNVRQHINNIPSMSVYTANNVAPSSDNPTYHMPHPSNQPSITPTHGNVNSGGGGGNVNSGVNVNVGGHYNNQRMINPNDMSHMSNRRDIPTPNAPTSSSSGTHAGENATGNNVNNGGSMWMPTKATYQGGTFPMGTTNEQPNLNPNRMHNQFGGMSDSNTHANDPMNQMRTMENPEQMTSNAINLAQVYPPEKDL